MPSAVLFTPIVAFVFKYKISKSKTLVADGMNILEPRIQPSFPPSFSHCDTHWCPSHPPRSLNALQNAPSNDKKADTNAVHKRLLRE